MNAIFLTQSTGVRMFYSLMKALREPLELDRVGFLLSYYRSYQAFLQEVPDLESGQYSLLKEWEITRNARTGTADLDVIRRYERLLGNPYLWGPIVADRRVYLGDKSAFFQDYGARFSHTHMLNILEAGLIAMERFFDEVQPDFVVSFICVTFSEYLGYLVARSRGIPVLNLRTTRMHNYVTYGESIFEPSERIREAYERQLTDGSSREWMEEAGEYVDFVRTEHARYDGNIALSIPGLLPRVPGPLRLPGAVLRTIRSEYEWRFGKVRDPRVHSTIAPMINSRVFKPLRVRWQHRRLSRDYVTADELPSLDYVLFPMHVEPEVTLLVYSTPYLNQIEVIRNVSQSIPVGMTLLVKEHPAAIGKRSTNYYKKLQEIPNVRLADPAILSKPAVENARLVASIAGSMGWEAILLRKPVVLFGHTPYEFLPDSMVRRVTDLEHLGEDIADVMDNYAYDAAAVLAYVAATMGESVRVNLYTTLLGRTGVYSLEPDTAGTDEAWNRDIVRLAQYTVESLKRIQERSSRVLPEVHRA